MNLKKTYPSARIGTPLLLVLLFALCLSALAVLTLSDALRNEAYSRQAAENTKKYYEADAQAREMLARIQNVLESTADAESVTDIDGIILEDKGDDKFFVVSYDVPIRDDVVLFVSLRIYKENAARKEHYQIVRWQEMSLDEWNAATTLPVLDSE